MKRLKNITLFFIGFCVYITIEVLFRGYSFPLMGVVGGLDFILIDRINNKISWCMDLLLQGIIGSGIITFSELIVGIIDKLWLHIGMWDYTTLPGNFMGVICPQFSLIWVFIAIVAVFLADAVNYYVFREEPAPHYHIFGLKFYMPVV